MDEQKISEERLITEVIGSTANNYCVSHGELVRIITAARCEEREKISEILGTYQEWYRRGVLEESERIFKEQLEILAACGHTDGDRSTISGKYLMEMLVRPAFGDSETHYDRVLMAFDKIQQKHLGGDDCSNCVSMRKRGVVGECICGKVHD